MRNEPVDQQLSYGSVSVTQRNRLPHWQTDRGVYFVTFNLFDAIPAEYRSELRRMREELVDEQKRACRRLTIQDERKIDRLLLEEIERKLDEGRGACFMREPEIAEVVDRALQFFNGQRYQLASSTVMPNHAHAVFRLASGILLKNVLHSWKSYTASMANRILGRSGTFWHEESYDRLIRTSEELASRVEYVVKNPFKGGCDPRWTRTYDIDAVLRS